MRCLLLLVATLAFASADTRNGREALERFVSFKRELSEQMFDSRDLSALQTRGVVSAVGDTVSGLVDDFCNKRGVVDWVSDKAKGAANWASDKAGKAKDWACNKIQGRDLFGQRSFDAELTLRNWDEIERTLGDHEMRGILSAIGDTVSGAVDSVCNRGVVDWAKDKAGAAYDWVKDKAGNAKDWACGKLQGRMEIGVIQYSGTDMGEPQGVMWYNPA